MCPIFKDIELVIKADKNSSPAAFVYKASGYIPQPNTVWFTNWGEQHCPFQKTESNESAGQVIMRYTKNIIQLRQAKKQWLKHSAQQEYLLHKAEDLSLML